MMKQIDILYNRYWEPTLRQFDNNNLVDFKWRHIGFIYENKLYNYKGHHVWWLEWGIMRDLRGNCVGFGKNPTDWHRPLLPIKQIPSIPSIVEISPIKPIRRVPYIKPIKKFQWSDFEPIGLFFNQQYNG